MISEFKKEDGYYKIISFLQKNVPGKQNLLNLKTDESYHQLQ